MSERELEIWGRYRFKYGPLNPIRMFDQGPALISSVISKVNGGKANPIDFMPYGKKQEDIIDGDTFLDRLSQHKGVKIGR